MRGSVLTPSCRSQKGTFWNRLLVAPILDGRGELIYRFASQFDVTLQRDRLTRLKDYRAALER